MTAYAGILLVSLLALDLYMAWTSRLDACVKASILQAVVLAALPFAFGAVGPTATSSTVWHVAAIAAGTIAAKAVLIPWLLFRALRGLRSQREFAPFVSLHRSQLVTGALCGAAFWIASALPWPSARGQTLALGVGLATLLIGLFMTVNRAKALSQVFGYLIIESGLFVIGWTLLAEPSLALELGALLDVLVGVMVMGLLAPDLDDPSDRTEDAGPLAADADLTGNESAGDSHEAAAGGSL